MRVIDQLRKKYPDIKWHYDMTKQIWEGSDGSEVRATFHAYDPDGENGELWRYFSYKEKKAPEWVGIELGGKT